MTTVRAPDPDGLWLSIRLTGDEHVAIKLFALTSAVERVDEALTKGARVPG